MQRRMSVKEMMSFLNQQEINTWFDLGIFIDHVKETNPVPVVQSTGSFDEYLDDFGELIVTIDDNLDISTSGLQYNTHAFDIIIDADTPGDLDLWLYKNPAGDFQLNWESENGLTFNEFSFIQKKVPNKENI